MNGADVWEWDSAAGVFIRADEAVGSAAPAAQSECLLVADSWLVTDGRVRAFAAHRRRFARSCQVRAGEAQAASDHFWDALVELLPRTGDWFPRVELVDGGPSQTANVLPLRFRVRPAPSRGTTVVVWDPQVPDARTHPQIKGPDLDQLGELRTKALALGAQEIGRAHV